MSLKEIAKGLALAIAGAYVYDKFVKPRLGTA